MQMLRQQINMGRCGEEKMLATLDILCSKEFQAQCTWTGASRKGPKTAIMLHSKVVDLFREIGTSETELVTLENVSSFFMKKLKNATKRLFSTGQRRGSRHCVPKRFKNEFCENTDDNVYYSEEHLSDNDSADSENSEENNESTYMYNN